MTPVPQPPAGSGLEPPPRLRVTQRDIAQAAGVDHTTVSRALRRDRGIPEATQQRIKAIAESLGYRTDPAMQALVSYRRTAGQQRRVASLAYLTGRSTRGDGPKIPAEEQTFQGARQKAVEKGYRIERLWLNEPGLSAAGLLKALSSRGVSGLVLSTPWESPVALEGFPWEKFTVVSLGHEPRLPAFHSIRYDVRSAVRLAMQAAHGLGYRRPALLLPRAMDREADHDWSFTFIAQQLRLGLPAPIPVLYLDDGAAPRRPGASVRSANHALATRLAGCRPDAILGTHPTGREFLASHGFTVPRDVAYIDLLRPARAARLAGIEPNHPAVGAAAIEVLARLQVENERGIPAIATTTWVPGRWHDGASLPRASARSSAAAQRGPTR